MSGPTAVIFTIEGAAVLAAAEAIAATVAVADSLAEERRIASEQRRKRLSERSARQQAAQQARQTRSQRLQELQAHHARLSALVDELVARGQIAPLDLPPLVEAEETTDATMPAGFASALEARLQTLRAHLAQAADALPELQPLLAGAATAAEAIDRWAAQTVLFSAAAQVEARRATVARILERLDQPPEAPLPPRLEQLAAASIAAQHEDEAAALASELRLAVQRHNEAEAEAERRRREADAAALVLEESLRDLGYEVENIEATLFVDGGMAHFRRAGWADYQVRLRIDPARGAMNFNVVRPKGEVSRHDDMLAEDRWCAEFPRLLQTLQARGIALTVTRQLAAGEAPVQQVDAASLPQWHEEEERRPQSAPRALRR